MDGLVVENLHVSVDGKEIVRGVSFTAPKGVITVIMGPNGSGKSTLLLALMGHPRYTVTGGRVLLDGEDLLALKPHERAQKGLFLAFQSPPELPGVKVYSFLDEAAKRLGLSVDRPIESILEGVGLPRGYADRSVHVGFSGGEKKRFEVAQALFFEPKVVMLDEPDSGLDIDGLRMLSEKLRELVAKGRAVLLVSHNPKTIEYVKPDKVLALVSGRIVAEGGLDLVERIESEGFPVVSE
ncbi:Fe-S cluster assembly ATPase SufC [Infirmifilum lucidum]|uniref:Fe-S cluster assembly ATPase SufC n=1 Tax=Infirmifilum lucidum TaxID=2776706 RepID=A0A7L9FIY8_9CREN|nr:Fe-S cluster assembly ATPase SufC [Infirmifilum lucidum]QOJ78884.1 Fe-S cluster assembly ATPase SufC [Infirmifilum lucidum]